MKKQSEDGLVTVKRPNIQTIEFKCVGDAPLVTHAFGAKAIAIMMATQEAGSKAKGKRVREPKDFQASFEEATHKAADGGWFGLPASAFRAAMISACKVAGVVMTRAKLSVFVEADGIDAVDGTPLVRIYGEREMLTMPVRNADGSVDIRARPMWRSWHIVLRVRYDADQFDASSVANLLMRAGMSVGVGEGRADSKRSVGMGWGSFRVEGTAGATASEAAE